MSEAMTTHTPAEAVELKPLDLAEALKAAMRHGYKAGNVHVPFDYAWTSFTGDGNPALARVQTACSALRRTPEPTAVSEWEPIETAPKDGTRILAWSAEHGQRETFMAKYQEGSPGYSIWQRGDGPLNVGWEWSEPISGCSFKWKPTHWQPLPSAPAALGGKDD